MTKTESATAPTDYQMTHRLPGPAFTRADLIRFIEQDLGFRLRLIQQNGMQVKGVDEMTHEMIEAYFVDHVLDWTVQMLTKRKIKVSVTRPRKSKTAKRRK